MCFALHRRRVDLVNARRISDQAGLPRDDNGTVEGFTGAVAADGTLYVAWADGNSIAFTSSHDGGRTFAKSRSVIPTAPLYFAAAGLDRASGFPQLDIDPRHGRKGLLYVTWSDLRRRHWRLLCHVQQWSKIGARRCA